jgi:hypothetical protein
VDGHTMAGHAEKAAHIWQEYRNILSCSTCTQMQFNLQDLIQVQDLQVVKTPFSKEDIDNIKIIPANKAPGHDGFSGVFLK